MNSKQLFTFLFVEKVPILMIRWGFNPGWCPICEKRSIFYKQGSWLRDQYRCIRCKSIPRWRALIHVLENYFPDWRNLNIHESSPGGGSSEKMARECKNYLASHYFPGIPAGHSKEGFRCENLEAQSFSNEVFDLTITQDVLEHILNPEKAFAEIARTLKRGGAHVFTVPWYYWKKTVVRAVGTVNDIRHLKEPEYHKNPVNPDGSLVTREWGADLADLIFDCSGLSTTILRPTNRKLGIDGKFIEVFISKKPF